MYISDETIAKLAKKNIRVKWYVEDTFEEYHAKTWKAEYKGYFNYCGEKLPETPENIAEAKKFADWAAKRACSETEHTKLYVTYSDKNRTFVRNTTKSQNITTEIVEKWISHNDKPYNGIYGKFADHTQKLLSDSDMKHHGFIYPTTYGIGIWVFYNWDVDKCKKWVENLLNSKKLDYYTEYSDAGLVYRYKISKARANIAKMNE